MPKPVTILAIESSTDETAACVLTGDISARQPKFNILSSVVRSQILLHRKYGGVVPELAAREHIKHIEPVVKKALADVNLQLSDLDYIAVTAGPGLVPALVVGVEFAKTISNALGIPLLPINHMEGHMYSAFGGESPIANIKYPIISLIVSGGHTMLVLMKDEKNYKVIGSTVDDASGEAFDKVARLLGLPYPGGPEISKLAETTKSTSVKFPRPMLNQKNFDFSFSGLKTAVVNYVKDHPKYNKAEIAKDFQDAVVDVLVQKTTRAAIAHKAKTITLTGGVAANKELRKKLQDASSGLRVQFIVPPFSLCTDNAGMIAIAAYLKLKNGMKPVPVSKVKADPAWEIW